MGECLDSAAFTGCAGPIMGLTCMCQDRCSHQLCQYSYQDLVALPQVHHHHHHYHPPPCDCLLCRVFVCCETAENRPLTEPTVMHPVRKTDSPPTTSGPPTHSVDLIQETTNTPTQLFSHRGLVFLTSADYIKTLSGVVFRVRLGPQSFTVILFYISVTIST